MYITASNAVRNPRLLAEISMCSISSFRPRRNTSSHSRAIFAIKTEMLAIHQVTLRFAPLVRLATVLLLPGPGIVLELASKLEPRVLPAEELVRRSVLARRMLSPQALLLNASLSMKSLTDNALLVARGRLASAAPVFLTRCWSLDARGLT